MKEAESHDFTINGNKQIKIVVYDTDVATSKVLKIYEKDDAGNCSEKDSMETIRLGMGDYGEGFQFVYIENNNIVVQQSFGDGKFLVISKLFFAYEKNGKIRLVKYAEEHIDRFSADKDFSDIVYEIPENIFFSDVDSDFVYKIHANGNVHHVGGISEIKKYNN
ncbi:MAG: hypothetical protein K2J68_07730 [Treponemataceae bacterium]|nr:hypothetical protein [Treponemataceae bacterium]